MLDNTIGNDRTMRPENEGQAKGATQSNEMSLGDARTLHPGEDGNLGRLDRYLLLRKLGGGGFGSVYLARDTVADIEVAVKGLPPLIKINPEELERVRNNFRLVQKLSHQNIAGLRVLHHAESVEYYDYDTEQGLRVDGPRRLSGGYGICARCYALSVASPVFGRQSSGRSCAGHLPSSS